MKKSILLITLMALKFYGFGQSAKTTTEINGLPQPAVSVAINADEDLVKTSLVNQLKSFGAKPDKDKHGVSAKNVKIPDVSDEPVDVYYKLDSKGRGDKEVTTVWFTLHKTQNLMAKDSSSEAEVYDKAVTYMNTLPDKVAADKKTEEVNALNKKKDEAANALKKAERKKNKADRRLEKKEKALEEAQNNLNKSNP